VNIVQAVGVFLIVGTFITFSAWAQPDSSCFLPFASEGPGSEGPYGMIDDSFESPLWRQEQVHVFHPQGIPGKRPVIFLSHKYGATQPEEYLFFIKHMVGKGYVVVFSPTRRATFTRKEIRKYNIFFEGYSAAVRRFSSIIDTTRIGFVGHGFGGGAAPALMLRAMRQCGWGASGAFMYILAPWYVYSVDRRGFETFPASVKVAVQVFEDDHINDPRIAADIYQSVNVPLTEKVFLAVASDRHGKCELRADDNTPLTGGVAWKDLDPLVHFGIFRTFDALAAYTFGGDVSSKEAVFPNGKSMSCFMGAWRDSVPVRPMIATRDPSPYLKKGSYFNRWKSPRNPRIEVSVFRRTRALVRGYFQNAWRLYLRVIGRNVERYFDENAFDDALPNPIVKGYGAPGRFRVTSDTFSCPIDRKLNVYIFGPRNAKPPFPVIFFLHGYVGQNPDEFETLIDHIVGKGYLDVYPTYSFFPRADNAKDVLAKYDMINAGIEQAIDLYKPYMDTAHIGFFGQSFGAGALPSVAYRLVADKKWGNGGAFMFVSAPWYVYAISQENLQHFPGNVNLLVQVYNEDHVDDHEMAVDLFNAIGIPAERKKFYTVYSDSSNGYVMHANHFVAYGVKNINGEQNLLDYYGVYKLFDAIADYSFTGNTAGRAIALGGGTKKQLYMGTWSDGRPARPMTVTNDPKAYYTELQYMYSFDNKLNPRTALKMPRSKLPGIFNP
jgi:dienelactone hydrolase